MRFSSVLAAYLPTGVLFIRLIHTISKLIANAIKDLNYPLGVGGPAQVLAAFASFFNQFFSPSIPIEPDHVVTFSGASTCLDGLLYAICDEGDSIILPSPFWGRLFLFMFLFRRCHTYAKFLHVDHSDKN